MVKNLNFDITAKIKFNGLDMTVYTSYAKIWNK